MNTADIWNFLVTQGGDFGLKLLTAIIAWVVGRWLITFSVTLLGKLLRRGGKIDETLANYLKSITIVLLNIVQDDVFRGVARGGRAGHWRGLEWNARQLRRWRVHASLATL